MVHSSPANGVDAGRKADDRLVFDTFRRNARTFSLAGRLLPRRTRLPVATLYLYCRTVDEIADRRRRGPAPTTEGLRELALARTALAAALDGRPPAGGPHALMWGRIGEMSRHFDLDGEAMFELMDGARWDLDGRPIDTRDDLLAYSELVAGSVGAMMLPLLVDNASRRHALRRPARALGVAMQITNILRDVGEDRALLGRVYLPTEDLARHGIDPSDLANPPMAGYRALCEELMALAESRYAAADPGISALPFPARLAVRAASRMYREILNEVRAAGHDNLSRRAVVPPLRKALAVTGSYERRRRGLLAGAA